MNIERIFHLLSIAFSFIDLNNIEYCTKGISDDGISSFKTTLLNEFPASNLKVLKNSLKWDRNGLVC